MRTIIDQLPKAIRWSNILKWISGIFTALLCLGGVLAFFAKPGLGIVLLLGALFVGVQFWMIRNYHTACKQAHESEDTDDIEAACQAQTTLVKFYGILSLIIIVIAILGIIAAFATPAYLSYLQRVR